MEKIIKKAIEANYDFEKSEYDGLVPQLKFSHNEFRMHKEYKVLMVRAVYLQPDGQTCASWVRFKEMCKRKTNQFVLDSLFWQALGKACGWTRRGHNRNEDELINKGMIVAHEDNTRDEWCFHALVFHEINLTEDWDKAINYLKEVTNEK